MIGRIIGGAGAALFTIVVYVFLLAPVAVLVFASFDDAAFFRFPPQAYSLRWYAAAAASQEYRSSLTVSFIVALLATLVSVGAGTLAARALVRGTVPGRGMVEAGAGDMITVNPGEVHDGAPIGDAGRSWRMLYFDPAVISAAAEDIGQGRSGSGEFASPAFRDADTANAFRASSSMIAREPGLPISSSGVNRKVIG